MTFVQTVVPDPFIPCKPGWCLQYVRQAFGAPVVEPTATAGWKNAKRRHENADFPQGVWVPVWFSLEHEPAGHVALLAPDGSVYSTTSPWGDRATHHPNMSHLLNAYSSNNPLTFLGWSEDISGVTVVEQAEIHLQAASIESDDMFTDTDREALIEARDNQRKAVHLLVSVSGMIDNVAASINEGKPVDLETMENARKLVRKVLDGVSE